LPPKEDNENSAIEQWEMKMDLERLKMPERD
jgi:hypothetical protein